MATNAPAIPRVEETGLDRDDLTSAAEELGIDDFDSLGDQQLFEQIGLYLGQISEDQLSSAAEQAEDTAEQAQDTTEDTAEQAQDTAEDTAEQAQETAEDTADEVQDTAEESDGASDAGDLFQQVRDTAEELVDQAQEVTELASEGAADIGEYRLEDDDRPKISSLLDLELGPVNLNLLGLEIHLNRVHAAVVANPVPGYAILGKLLAPVGTVTNAVGVDKLTDGVTDMVDSTLDALPSPDDGDGDGDDDEGEGALSSVVKPLTAAGRVIKNLVTNSKDVAGEAKEAGVSGAGALRNAASGNTLRAMKDGRKAMSHATGAAQRTATLASDS